MYNIKLKQEFWTNFGQYMLPVLSAEGERVSWLNYKTGIKHLYFKMDADRDFASIGIYFRHPGATDREQLYQQFRGLKSVLEEEMGEAWQWDQQVIDEYGKPYSRIFLSIDKVNIYEKQDWPIIISFFKTRMIALDRFWSLVKDSLIV